MCLRPSKGKQFLSIVSVRMVVVLEQTLTCCSLGPRCSVVIAMFSSALHPESQRQSQVKNLDVLMLLYMLLSVPHVLADPESLSLSV